MTDLSEKKCQSCTNGTRRLSADDIEPLIKKISDWTLTKDNTTLRKAFVFKGYYKTIAFVNAVAWIAHQEGHHPDLYVTYNQCVVEWSTHAIQGLSENDFICAAKVDVLNA